MMDPFYGMYDFENDQSYCPKCGSGKVDVVTDDDIITGLGLYVLYNIPQGLSAYEGVCICHACGHVWKAML